MGALFITHPEVDIDASTPVPRWRLSERGISRMRTFVASEAVSGVTDVWASTETKAIEAAGLLAARFGLPVNVHPDLGENDRSSTGFVPPAQFEVLADKFFANPSESVGGWETALAAQHRVRRAVCFLLSKKRVPGDIAIVAHGGVGALLMCAMLGCPITRAKDQPFQGSYWTFEPETGNVIHEWKPIAPR